jgi:large subunit ribosomal protein L17
MRHGKGYRKLGVQRDHRRSLLSNLAGSFMLTGRIKTTVPKAKEARRLIERLITWARKDTLHTRRLIVKKLYDKGTQERLLKNISPVCDTPGGYTRIVRLGRRKGDGADMCFLELSKSPLEDKEETIETTPAESKE